jgi:hypothetical protein
MEAGMNETVHCPITVLIVSHNKPDLLPEAVQSVLAQTLPHWQGILIDSGLLYDRGLFKRHAWSRDPRLAIVRSPETPAQRRHKAMAPWCFNECFRRGWVQGELVMYLCDDDIFYPNAFATFVDAFQKNPDAMAMYASQDIGWIAPDGTQAIVEERRALAPGGKCCNGRLMDCQVDYLQLCHRRTALRVFSDPQYWPEDKSSEDHADGLFMEKLGSHFPILPVDIKIGQNRRTPSSINVPSGRAEVRPRRQPTCLSTDVSEPIDTGSMSAMPDAPVHETIMNAWTVVRNHVDRNSRDEVLKQALADFQAKLRSLCEQDYAQRRRLTSERYRLADRLHAQLTRVPGVLRLSKYCQRVLKSVRLPL